MTIKSRIASWLGGVLLLGAQLGCDSGGSTLANAAGGSGGMGGSATAATTCSLTSQCTNQVCSPDGRCVDCYESRDCAVGLTCQAERCLAEGASGGSSNGGSGGSSGSSGAAGGGGMPAVGSGSCGGAQVLFVIQRSGSMFEEPEGDASYWDMVKDAVAGPDGVSTVYAGKLDLGALFFVRLQYEQDKACPLVSSAAPAPSATVPLSALFESNAAEYATLSEAQAKMDAPVPEAVAAAAGMLGGAARHLVLITTAVPDSCTLADSECTVDLAVKAVQDAQQQGVTTHVLGLGDTDALNASDDDNGYGTYLKQLANAGRGKPVAMSKAFDEQCAAEDATATYGDANGDAQAYQAETAAEVKAAIGSILTSICP